MTLGLFDPAFLGGLVTTPAGPTDPYFSNVSLLLHGDGANGSTTFLDSSPSPKSVVPYGDAQINTTVTDPFGRTGVGVISLDGTGDLLGIPQISISQNESFTVEAWVYKIVKESGYSMLIRSGGTYFGYDLLGPGTVYMLINNSLAFFNTDPVLLTESWTHLAYVRNVGVCTAYCNGVPIASGTAGSAFYIDFIGAGSASGGSDMKGYIDELRITKGVARYQSTFTPPTAPFPDA